MHYYRNYRYRRTSYSTMPMNRISWKLLISSIWLMEEKMFHFDHIIDIRDEPAKLGPARTILDGL